MTGRMLVASLVAAAFAPLPAGAAAVPDGEYRCDASSDTTAQFLHLVVADGRLAEFELAAVNRLRADVCQLGFSHFDPKVRAQATGWQLDYDADGAPCRVTLARRGESLSIGMAGAGCASFCGTRTSFWPMTLDVGRRACRIG